MDTIRTLTVRQIAWLQAARESFYEWRGAHDPNELDEFDGWIKEVDDAIATVKVDRERLRAALDYIAKSPCDPDIYADQHAAWKKLQRLNAKAERLRERAKN